MFKYAQLDTNDIVVAISDLAGAIVADNMILVNELDLAIGSTYNRETGEFSSPEPQSDVAKSLSMIEETRIEQLYQTALLEITLL